MKPTDMHEGPEAFTRFQNLMRSILTVPHSEIQAEVKEHRERAAKNPKKRGPKSKAKR